MREQKNIADIVGGMAKQIEEQMAFRNKALENLQRSAQQQGAFLNVYKTLLEEKVQQEQALKKQFEMLSVPQVKVGAIAEALRHLQKSTEIQRKIVENLPTNKVLHGLQINDQIVRQLRNEESATEEAVTRLEASTEESLPEDEANLSAIHKVEEQRELTNVLLTMTGVLTQSLEVQKEMVNTQLKSIGWKALAAAFIVALIASTSSGIISYHYGKWMEKNGSPQVTSVEKPAVSQNMTPDTSTDVESQPDKTTDAPHPSSDVDATSEKSSADKKEMGKSISSKDSEETVNAFGGPLIIKEQ